MSKKEKIYKSSGNIFADIGLSCPERVKVRAEIMLEITEIIKKQKLTQKSVGAILNIPQSKVSCLLHGKLSMFSLDHLLEFLKALDRDVHIIINQKAKKDKPAVTEVLQGADFLPSRTYNPVGETLGSIWAHQLKSKRMIRVVNIYTQNIVGQTYSLVSKQVSTKGMKTDQAVIFGVV